MNIKKPIVIAEIGCNHLGDFNIAKEMIEIASKYAGVDVVKFQKRDNKLLYSKEEYNKPHPVPENSYGKTYGEHRDFLEFDLNTHKKLQKICKKNNLKLTDINGLSYNFLMDKWNINKNTEVNYISRFKRL